MNVEHIEPTSVRVERLFSSVKLFYTSQRQAMKLSLLENLSFLNCNRDFWDLEDVKILYASKKVNNEVQSSTTLQSTIRPIDEDDINSLYIKYDIPMELENRAIFVNYNINELQARYNDPDELDYGEETENNEELMGDEELSDEYDELESDDDSSGD